VQTAEEVVERCLLMTTDPGDLVVDPTCGSGTTAVACEKWARRWITIDTSRVAIALARTRVMVTRYPYFVLADSVEGRRLLNGDDYVDAKTPNDGKPDIHKGFVLKQVPLVKLSTIAGLDAIDAIWERWRHELDALLARINEGREVPWEEWQVPYGGQAEAETVSPDVLKAWWDVWLARQGEIDGAIASASSEEPLVDQPNEDKLVVRVTGPFTVESLSPHRVAVTRPQEGPPSAQAVSVDAGRFVDRIVEELRAAGVQNTFKDERLVFNTLELYAGSFVQGRQVDCGCGCDRA
jgi:adenine-specific DNA-methyltransferase